MTLTNLGVMVTQLNNHKMRFVSDGFAGECELLGNQREYVKLVRMSVTNDYEHDQLVRAQELIAEWQRSDKSNG